MAILGGDIMFKEGDKVKFIEHDTLGIFSGRKGTIEKLVDDEIYGDERVYEVHIPFHGNVEVLSSFIDHIEK